MSDSEHLIAQLRRSNRRWKVLALAACSALILAAVLSYAKAARERMQVERAMADVRRALASVEKAENPGQPR
jgi:hypothetical protein